MQPKHIRAYMNAAKGFAECSTAVRLKVGAVVVKNHKVISVGYNGTPNGWDNNCETKEWCTAGGWLDPEEINEGWPYEGEYYDLDGNLMQGRYRLATKPEVIHAEANAISKLAREGGGADGASLFVTHGPCLECAKLIHQTGITEVFYEEEYRSAEGLYFLQKAGINLRKV